MPDELGAVHEDGDVAHASEVVNGSGLGICARAQLRHIFLQRRELALSVDLPQIFLYARGRVGLRPLHTILVGHIRV